MPVAQQLPLILRAPMFPADPTLTAKPVTLTVGGSKGTVIGPLKVTFTPEELVRTTLEKVFEDPEVFVNANVPDARVPGINPVDGTVFDCAGDVALISRADTSRMLGFGL